MYHSEDMIRAGLADAGTAGPGRLHMELAMDDIAWNPGGEDFAGPCALSYEQHGDSIRVSLRDD